MNPAGGDLKRKLPPNPGSGARDERPGSESLPIELNSDELEQMRQTVSAGSHLVLLASRTKTL